MALVFVAFLVIGMALPILPLHVHDMLGFGSFTVGLVTGCQFAASLLSRPFSGQISDHRGPKRTIVLGLMAAAVAGALYFSSVLLIKFPAIAVMILLLGRAVMGAAESFIITGATVWGLAQAGAANAGKAIAWTGTAMFAALALGAPVGSSLYAWGGLFAIAMATTVVPLATFALVVPMATVAPAPRQAASLFSVLDNIWVPGLGAALSSVGFGVIVTFGSLLFAQRGWTPIWLAFSAYSVALIVARLVFGHLPDRIGGARVALYCVVIEALGLAAMGLAPSAAIATLGAILVGLGYALVFPGLGIEAVRRAPPENRGIAMATYTACLDVALGISGPALGLIAGRSNLPTVFVVGAAVVLLSLLFVVRLVRSR